VKGTKKGVAMKSDVNPFFCAADPTAAARSPSAEAGAFGACVGRASSGHHRLPELRQSPRSRGHGAVRGVGSRASRTPAGCLSVPVVSGNVSFYNETDGRAIPPTPTVGMVGLLEDVSKHVPRAFPEAGDLVALLGQTRDELGASEFLRTIRGRDEGPCPEVDLEPRRSWSICWSRSPTRLLASAHDVSDGGLAVAIAECAMQSGRGVEIACSDGLRHSALLFGESTGRAVVSFAPELEPELRAAAKERAVPLEVVGRVGGDDLRISVRGELLIDERSRSSTQLWRTAFVHAIESADVL
jgi:phosphoribosylformylglycinamidine synthase